ncbi:MAG: ABC transporter permease, partial [Planctomycetaceae bacterium]
MRESWVIVERELLALLRTNRALGILLFVAIGFAAVVLLKWPTDSIVALSGSQPRQVFQGLAYAMLTTAVLVVPVFPATSLVREIRKKTLQLLLHSPLKRTSIYLGKLGAMFGFILLLMFATLPALVCCYAMGGISFGGDVLKLYVFLIIVCLQLAVVGLLVGTYARTPEAALRWGYGLTFLVVVVPVIPDLFLRGSDTALAEGASLLKAISPIPALLQRVQQDSIGGTGLIESRNLVTWYLVIAIAFIILGSLWCIRR